MIKSKSIPRAVLTAPLLPASAGMDTASTEPAVQSACGLTDHRCIKMDLCLGKLNQSALPTKIANAGAITDTHKSFKREEGETSGLWPQRYPAHVAVRKAQKFQKVQKCRKVWKVWKVQKVRKWSDQKLPLPESFYLHNLWLQSVTSWSSIVLNPNWYWILI